MTISSTLQTKPWLQGLLVPLTVSSLDAGVRSGLPTKSAMILITYLYFRNISHCACKSVYMFMYVDIHLHPGSCGVQKPKAGVFLSIFSSALCLKQTFTEPGSCQFRQSWWSGGPKDPRVSSFPGLVLQTSPVARSFLTWNLGIEFRPSHVHSKLFTDGAISPASISGFLSTEHISVKVVNVEKRRSSNGTDIWGL